MQKRKSKPIAWVIPPITLSMSAQAKFKRTNPFREWGLQHEDPIIFSTFSRRWIPLSKIFLYPEGLLWLLLILPLKLIKGKYSLFISSARDPQVIIVFLISKLLRKPIVISDTFFMWSDSIQALLFWPFTRYVASHGTVLKVCGSRVMNFWISAGVPSKKIKISHAYISTIEASRNDFAEAKKIREKLGYQKTILFIGRLIQAKGVDYLIRAFGLLQDLKKVGLVIVGDGPDRKRFQMLCKELNLSNVTFIWRDCEREEIAPYYLMSDVVVLPSVTIKCHEEWGLVVNEAMSVGKPVVVSTAVGCAYELVRNNINGYIVPEKDAEALGEALRKLVTNDQLRTQMGKAAEKTIKEEFTYTHAIEKSKKSIQEIFREFN